MEFERIAMNPAETALQREANLKAADLYTKAGNMPKAVAMLETFVVTYPTPVSDSIEARQKLADIAGTAGDVEKRALAARDRRTPIAARAPGAPIARNTSPPSRSSRWLRRRATSSAASRWCCR